MASGPTGVSPMTVAAAASEHYDLLWLVDESGPDLSLHVALLGRLGRVVELGGLSGSEAAAVLADYRPDGIATFHDFGMVKLAEIAEQLNLPFHKPAVAERLVDKYAQREALMAGGLAVPRYAPVPLVLDDDALAALEARVGFPAVLKPRSGTGSRYVVSVPTSGALVEALVQRRRDGRNDPLLLEEFIGEATSRDAQIGDIVSVESYVSAGRVSNIAVTGRFAFAEPFRETGNFIPADLPEAERTEVLQLATEAARALGVETGCLHTEIKRTKEGPRLVEINGRPGGGIPQMLARVSDLNLFHVAFQLALGESLPDRDVVPTGRVVYRAIVQPPTSAHRVVSVQGLETVAELPGVEEVILNRGPGRVVDWRNGYLEFVFLVDGTVADIDELRVIDRRLRDAVVIVYE